MSSRLKIPVPLQIIPAPENLYAVFAAEQDGTVIADFQKVIAIGNFELDPDPRQPIRVSSGICVGNHLEPADWRPAFLGYFTGEPDSISKGLWSKAAEAKQEQLRVLREKAAQSKIIVPQGAIPEVFQ